MKTLNSMMAKAAPEWTVVVTFFLLMLVLRQYLGAPLQLFTRESFNFVEISYLLPFIAVSLWIVLPLPLLYRSTTVRAVVGKLGQQAGDATCFLLLLWCHFHIKLWIPLLHPVSYDSVYESIDRTCFFWVDPFIRWRSHWPQIDAINHLYVSVFVGMFVCSFILHNLRSRAEFRRVFLASLLVQATGAISYLIAPAVGPYIFHPSANAWTGGVQQYLYDIRQQLVSGGNSWLEVNTGSCLPDGLAAMPSLHAAASFVFLYYAWRYCRWLCLLYVPAFSWIIFEAMATRWHYGIDLVAGIALSCGCLAVTHFWMAAHEAAAKLALVPGESMAMPQASREDEPILAMARVEECHLLQA